MDDNSRYVGAFISDGSAAGRVRVGCVNAAGTCFVAGAIDTLAAVGTLWVYRLRNSAMIDFARARPQISDYRKALPTL